MIKQISAFIENKPGRLLRVTSCLASENINIHALSIADTTDFGILRMIVSNPDKAKQALRDNGFTVKTTEVVAIAMRHTPGYLHSILTEFERLGINIEYMYAFTSRLEEDSSIVILRLSRQNDVIAKLDGGNVKLLGGDLLDRLNNAV